VQKFAPIRLRTNQEPINVKNDCETGPNSVHIQLNTCEMSWVSFIPRGDEDIPVLRLMLILTIGQCYFRR